MDNHDELIPEYPNFTMEEWGECESSGDFTYILFEWYRWVGNIATIVGFIDKGSLDFRPIEGRDYHLLSGLMTRCARLMLSILALTHEGKFGEGASIIHRSLMESAVKIMWLTTQDTSARCRQLVANGLKPEIEFERQILDNIAARDGIKSSLEERMLASIERHFLAAELTRQDVSDAKKVPDLANMFKSIGWDRLQYVVLQRIGSHAVHGNWPSLLSDYLEPNGKGSFRPRGEPVPMHPNSYMSGAQVVLSAIAAYCSACFAEESASVFIRLTSEATERLMEDYNSAIEKGL